MSFLRGACSHHALLARKHDTGSGPSCWGGPEHGALQRVEAGVHGVAEVLRAMAAAAGDEATPLAVRVELGMAQSHLLASMDGLVQAAVERQAAGPSPAAQRTALDVTLGRINALLGLPFDDRDGGGRREARAEGGGARRSGAPAAVQPALDRLTAAKSKVLDAAALADRLSDLSGRAVAAVRDAAPSGAREAAVEVVEESDDEDDGLRVTTVRRRGSAGQGGSAMVMREAATAGRWVVSSRAVADLTDISASVDGALDGSNEYSLAATDGRVKSVVEAAALLKASTHFNQAVALGSSESDAGRHALSIYSDAVIAS